MQANQNNTKIDNFYINNTKMRNIKLMKRKTNQLIKDNSIKKDKKEKIN